MQTLQTQSKQFCCVIRKNVAIPSKKLTEFCSSYATQWAFIEHKGDISPESGEIEGIHYHLVLLLPKRKRGYTILNDITKYFGFENGNGIEVAVMQSLEGSIQYLTHKNDKDKTPHDFEEIKSNFNPEELKTIYEAVNNSLTFDRIKVIINDAENICDVIEAVGFTQYNTYRNTIRDMWNWYKHGKD